MGQLFSPSLMKLADYFSTKKARADEVDPNVQVAEQPDTYPVVGNEVAQTGDAATSPGQEQVTQDTSPPDQNDQWRQYQEEKYAKTQPYLQKQEAGVEDLRSEVQKLKDMPQQWNFAPLLAYADSISGGNTLKGYTAPQSQAEKQQAIIKLKDMIQKEQGNLTSKQIAALQDKGLATMLGQSAKLGQGQERISQKDVLNAQSQANNAEKQFTPRLEGANRIQGIFQDMASGKVKTNAAAKSLIISEIQRLETGASNPAYEGQTQKEMKTSAEKLGELIQVWGGKPQDSVPPEIMKQVEALATGMTHKYMQQADTAYNNLKAGARPVQKEVFNARHGSLQNQYKERFGYWGDSQAKNQAPAAAAETVERKTADGKTALFDATTKKFLGYK